MHIKILVVDDEQSQCLLVKRCLEAEGYIVSTALSVDEARKYDLPSFSLIILDIMMGKVNGFEFAHELKHSHITETVPILFCSSLSNSDEKVLGLNIGADDYIVKPYVTKEFLARVKSILRRSGITKLIEMRINEGCFIPDLIFKTIRIDRNSKTVYLNANKINLTKREYGLLLFLAECPNEIHSREEIMQNVWGKNSSTFRTIDTTITRLRKKLGSSESVIMTRLGYGYEFCDK